MKALDIVRFKETQGENADDRYILLDDPGAYSSVDVKTICGEPFASVLRVVRENLCVAEENDAWQKELPALRVSMGVHTWLEHHRINK